MTKHPKFFVESAGRLIPLEEAVWVKWAPCGCAWAAQSAVLPAGEPILTEDQAFRKMQEKTSHPKDLVEKFRRDGFVVSLITEKKYIEVMYQALYTGCGHNPIYGGSKYGLKARA